MYKNESIYRIHFGGDKKKASRKIIKIKFTGAGDVP